MGIFIDENGFNKKTYAELKTEYEDDVKEIFGDDVDLDPSGPLGQWIGLRAQRDADIWEGVEEIYNSRDPNSAEGISLDKIAAETGIIRQSATKTTVYNALLYGSEGTLVEAGKESRQSVGDYSTMSYILLEDVTITKASAREVVLTIQSPSDAETFTVTIDSTPYSYVATVPSDDAEAVATAIKTAIEAGSFTGTVSRTGAVLTITDVSTENNPFDIDWTTNITLDALASGGDFEAELAGEIPLSANTLDTIVTPVSGWDSINNPNSGITGRKREEDSELRIRRNNTIFTGNATEDAIVAAVSNNVSGITKIGIKSNRTDATVSGLPPHSFEVVVAGGDEDDIAQQIWETQPAGIQSTGNITKIVVDSEGESQTIKFSRPTPIYIHVKVKRDKYSEETYPTDGDTQIKTNILDWANENMPIGKDLIRQRLNTPVYEVPGIENIEITLDGTANPGDTPSFALQNIEILNNEYADFALNRIFVENLTP